MAAPDDIDNAKRLELACALQTTLDVETLIGILGEHLRKVVPHAGLRFVNDPAALDIGVGNPTGHYQAFRSASCAFIATSRCRARARRLSRA
jgi:hypothetical protein